MTTEISVMYGSEKVKEWSDPWSDIMLGDVV